MSSAALRKPSFGMVNKLLLREDLIPISYML